MILAACALAEEHSCSIAVTTSVWAVGLAQYPVFLLVLELDSRASFPTQFTLATFLSAVDGLRNPVLTVA